MRAGTSNQIGQTSIAVLVWPEKALSSAEVDDPVGQLWEMA